MSSFKKIHRKYIIEYRGSMRRSREKCICSCNDETQCSSYKGQCWSSDFKTRIKESRIRKTFTKPEFICQSLQKCVRACLIHSMKKTSLVMSHCDSSTPLVHTNDDDSLDDLTEISRKVLKAKFTWNRNLGFKLVSVLKWRKTAVRLLWLINH